MSPDNLTEIIRRGQADLDVLLQTEKQSQDKETKLRETLRKHLGMTAETDSQMPDVHEGILYTLILLLTGILLFVLIWTLRNHAPYYRRAPMMQAPEFPMLRRKIEEP
jgi:hypothetical protein